MDLRKTGLVTFDTVAANAHGNFLLARLDVTLDLLGMGGKYRPISDKQNRQ